MGRCRDEQAKAQISEAEKGGYLNAWLVHFLKKYTSTSTIYEDRSNLDEEFDFHKHSES